MNEYRCRCGRLLFRGILKDGSRVEIQCWHRQCRRLNTISLDLVADAVVS